MNLLNRLTIKNLKLNKKRTIVTIIGIMLSVALLTVMSTVYSGGVKSLIELEKNLQGNFHVAFLDVPITEVKKIEKNQGVESVYFSRKIGYASIPSKNDAKPYAYIAAFDDASIKNLSINLLEGRYPKNDSEILIPSHLESNGRVKYKVGDTITLNIGKRVSTEDGAELTQDDDFSEDSEKITDTHPKEYKIVGKIARPSNKVENFRAPGYTFVTYYEGNSTEGNTTMYVLLNKYGRKNYYKIVANILGIDEVAFQKLYEGDYESTEEYDAISKEVQKAKYEILFNKYLILLESNPFDKKSLGGLATLFMIVVIITIVASVFCIKNSFDISVTEKIKQYGMLRSVGATKKQIRANVFREATILGLIGIPLGVVLGLVADIIFTAVSNTLIGKINMQDGFKIYLSFRPMFIAIAIIAGIITVYLSALSSAIKSGRITPIKSITNADDIKIKRNSIRSPKIIKKIFGIGGDISYKNLKRSRKKYRTTVISIVVSVAIFIALSYFMVSLVNVTKDTVGGSDYDIHYTTTVYKAPTAPEKILKTLKLDGIKEYSIRRENSINLSLSYVDKKVLSGLSYVPTDGEGKLYAKVVAIGEDAYKNYIKTLNLKYEDVKNKAILYNYFSYTTEDGKKHFKELLSLKGGDKVDVTSIDDLKFTLDIETTTKELPLGGNFDNEIVFIVSDELYDSIKFDSQYEWEVYLTLEDKKDASKIQDEIDKILLDEQYNLTNVIEQNEQTESVVLLIGITLYGFIIVISLIGITNIFNTITTNMELRRREFATLKSVGMTKKEFNRMVRLESLFMGVKSLVFGTILGFLISFLMYKVLYKDEVDVEFLFPYKSVIIASIAVFIVIFAIMRYSIKKIESQNIIETIRNENI